MPEPGEARLRAYLRAALAPAAAPDAEALLDLRAEALGLAAAPAGSPPATDREAVEGALAALAERLWECPHDEVLRELDGLDLAPFPDLRPVAERLRRASGLREDLDAAEREAGGGRTVLAWIRKYLLADPAKAFQILDDLESALAGAKGVSAEVRPKPRCCARTARRIKRRQPRLYAEGEGLLSSVIRYRRMHSHPLHEWILAIVVVTLSVGLALMRVLMASK